MNQPNEPKLRLMVVDDEADNLDLLYRTFRREFEVFKAESALKALEILAQEEEMAIIISDQRMPKMNGTEFLSIAAKQFPDTIRILLTGYTDVEDLVGAINTGKVFKYITKPWSPDDLRTVVQQASDTYRVLKQRTNELNRALRRESLFNAVTTAIRESLDYFNMLQTIAETIGQTFAADACILRPIEELNRLADKNYRFASNTFSYFSAYSEPLNLVQQLIHDFDGQEPRYQDFLGAIAEKCQIQQNHLTSKNDQPLAELLIPLAYQQELLAVISLYKHSSTAPWLVEEIQLLEEVAQQAALAISQAKLYQRIQQQTEQMRAELAVARQIQTNLLRQSWPKLETVNIQACCDPAREVGGDFFEVYIHPQGDIWLAVGDVSGKGVPAALFMASAISVLRRELAQEAPPAPNEVMKTLNSTLSEDLVGSNCFITMVLARYNPSEKQLIYANAGHVYPLVWSKITAAKNMGSDTAIALEPNYLKVRGVPLGILPVWRADAGTLNLSSGDIFLLISDGITEATVPHNPSEGGTTHNSMLNQSGLWKILLQQGNTFDLNHVLAHIQVHNQVQEDDQTLLSLEVL